MGLTLLLGRAGSGKTRSCLEEVRSRLRRSPEGNPLILLVPEHATFELERELATTPELGGFSRAYVFGFRRLAHRVLLETGGALKPHISELGKRLVLSRLMVERQEELTVFRRAARQRNFAETLAGMITEFKTYAVAPEQLHQAWQGLEGTPLADKLHDLYLLYHEFELFLQFRYTDPEDYLYMLLDRLPQSALLRGAELWIDGFIWFNPRELAVLTGLLRTTAHITLTLCLADPDLPEHRHDTALFHRQWNTRRRLLELAAAAGVTVEQRQLAGSPRLQDRPALRHIERYGCTFPAVLYQGEPQGLRLVEAANRRIEVEGMARAMIRLCREEGYRWREMAILLRNPADYLAAINTVFTDYDIPYFSDSKRQPVHHPLAELLRSSLEAIAGRWSYEPLFRCFKTDLFPLSRADIDSLENYVLAFGIRGSRWTSAEPWTFVRRLSLSEEEEPDEAQAEYLDRLHQIRLQAMAPLITLADRLKQADAVRPMTQAVYELLEGLQVAETLEQWGLKAEQAGDLEQAREHRQIWGALMELLDQMVETCGDQRLSLTDFTAVLEDGLESLQISLIPPGLDYVTVMPLERFGAGNVKAVFVPGVNDGMLPLRGRGEGVITDAERTLLADTGLSLAPGAVADSFTEQFLVYTALTRASRELWLSYSLADEEGKGLAPSLLVKRLRELIGVGVQALPLEPAAGSEQEYIAHPRRSLSGLAASLRLYKCGEPISPLWWDVYNWARQRADMRIALQRSLAGLFYRNQPEPLPRRLAERLYVRGQRLRGSVTRFESYRACPFRHFSQYGLGLKERAAFRLAALDLGQFLHGALKEFGDRAVTLGRAWGDLTAVECRALCGEIVAALAPKLQNEILLSSAQYKHLLGRLTRTVERAVGRLADFDRVSRFKPIALEQTFGRAGALLPSPVYALDGGIVLELTGQIDRIDSVEHEGRQYLLIMDYKSGGAWLQLPEVYYGLKLQLLTYLLVAQNASRLLTGHELCLPGGVLYYFVKNPSLTGNAVKSAAEINRQLNDQLKMPGWILAEPVIVRLLDGTLQSRSEFLKVALKQDGSFYQSSRAYVKSAAEFALLAGHTRTMLLDTAAEVVSGHIGMEPFRLAQQTACTYCRYFPVCQFDRLLPENDYRQLNNLSDEAIMRELTKKKEDGL